MKFIDGWKTHILMGGAFVVGLLDQLKAIDLKQTMIDLGVPADRTGFIMATMAIGGIVLRQMQPTGVSQKDQG